MAKQLSKKDMYLGQLVTRTNEHEYTCVYTIGALRGRSDGVMQVYLVWFEGTRQCGQWADSSGCYLPTLRQVEASIFANGRLANSRDITSLNLD